MKFLDLIFGSSRKSKPHATSNLQLETLEPRLMLSTVEVIAAGTTGDELIELEIDGAVVQTWNGLNDDAYSGEFETLTYSTGATVNPGQVRINFLNDLYDPANGIDRNVRIDAIVIDGVRFETEAPTVFSTGTWLPADGIVPGFRQSEFLHSNGYFQYASSTGSVIDVRASGSEGGEEFSLIVAGQTVAAFTATTSLQTFSYTSNTTVTEDQVRIEFTNDLWIPGSVDRNLRVDFVKIDGTTYQTEAPTVFSTGTWLPADGIVPGFRQSETLHTNGYFQYAAEFSSVQPQVLVLENGAYGGRYLRLDASGNAVLSTTIDARSQWRVTDGGAGSYLQNVATGQFLKANGGGNVDVSNVSGNATRWTIVDNGASGLTLRNIGSNGFLDGDPGSEGWNVEQSTSAAADDFWLPTVVDRAAPDVRFLPGDNSVTFAAFGDYGTASAGTPAVAALVDQLGPDILVGLGDARYGSESYSSIHDPFYSNYVDDDSPGGLNRFFSAVGNHDYDDGGGLSDYLNYFNLPGDGVPNASNTGSELFYDYVWGPVHFFVVDSEAFLNDSASAATQSAWLQAQMQASTSPWQIVVMHRSPYSSGNVGPAPALRLPYQDWGADLVLSSHDHIYERLEVNNLPYVVSGLGGKSIFGFSSTDPNSIVQYSDDFGINMFTATNTQIIGTFVSVDGVTQDTFVITAN